MPTIDVDLALHKLIEANRRSLSETHYQIVSRVLRNALTQQETAHLPPVTPRLNRPSRKRGFYRFRLFGHEHEERSLKLVLKSIILEIEKRHRGFLEKLAAHRTPKGRRIVARKPEELYPGRPDLAETHAERLNASWWFDTNISVRQLKRYVERIIEIAGLDETDVMLHF